jgi:hypothetical protein
MSWYWCPFSVKTSASVRCLDWSVLRVIPARTKLVKGKKRPGWMEVGQVGHVPVIARARYTQRSERPNVAFPSFVTLFGRVLLNPSPWAVRRPGRGVTQISQQQQSNEPARA